jgi:hypothetical protein
MVITDKLLSILAIVNEWLRFAEAKNAVLLAFCGAGITAIATFLAAGKPLTWPTTIGLGTCALLLGISSLVSSLSFIPKTDLDHLIWRRQRPKNNARTSQASNDNLYYFNSLRKYGSYSLLDALNKDYFEGRIAKPYKKEDLDLASQITINSDIASGKFMLFAASARILAASIAFALALSIVSLICCGRL